ncbi:MAG: MotA/TolQ/ExbB proton channel family protein [Spongiibacteraceae bacterium]|nr:MotA/TolQ/ExbB proton channel family protein [Spongiibacteraceae bacterium]
MFEIILSGGWLMLPILLGSMVALAICIERYLALQPRKIAPRHLLGDVWGWVKNNQLNAEKLRELKKGSPLGLLLATGLTNARHGRELMKESIEEAASYVVHDLERYLNTLGTIAVISPLLGLLGTVVGMIDVFNQVVIHGSGNPAVLADGISKALITTAAGLTVAIPALFMHRYFTRRVDEIVVVLEQESIKLVDAVHGDRKVELKEIA